MEAKGRDSAALNNVVGRDMLHLDDPGIPARSFASFTFCSDEASNRQNDRSSDGTNVDRR
jgi:hypothetical protein